MPKYFQPRTWKTDPVTLLLYQTCRGRDVIGPQPVFRSIIVTGFEVMNDIREPIGGGGTSRDDLLYGTYKPNKDTVGHITPRSDLTEYNSSATNLVVLNTPNMVISGKIIYGIIQRGANNITIQDSLCVGPLTKPTSESAVIRAFDVQYTGLKVKDVTIAPRFPNPNMDGIKGDNYIAERVHVVWCVDGFGIFTPSGNRATNTRILGCLVEAHAYFHGQAYASGGTQYWNGTSYTAFGGSTVIRPVDNFTDAGHNDGNHNDSIQVQGGYGYMIRSNPNSDEEWVGDGIWIHGNYLNSYDALHNMADPTNSQLIVPGQAGSVSGSKLGTQDSPKRKNQSPSDTPPIMTSSHLDDGKFPANGASLAVTPNVNQFPHLGTDGKWTLVVTRNWVDNANIMFNIQKSGKSFSGLALLNNRIGEHIYTFDNGSNYVMRIYTGSDRSTIRFSTTHDGQPGLQSNKWDGADNRWGIEGDPIYEDPLTTGGHPRGGIVYS